MSFSTPQPFDAGEDVFGQSFLEKLNLLYTALAELQGQAEMDAVLGQLDPVEPVYSETFRITAATQDGANKRWTYTARRQEKASAGYDGFSDHSSDETAYTLYSINEAQNGSTGTYGNGVTEADLTAAGGTYALVQIPVDTLVEAKRVLVNGGAVEWWIINLPNGVTGQCE